jgi:hypothetical protein
MHNTATEKYQNRRDNIVNVRERIREIDFKDIYISNISWPYLIDNYLLVRDYKSPDKQIHIFNKNNFDHITSIANRGKGPGEIANIGYIAVDNTCRQFYVMDDGKQRIFSYHLDSVLTNSSYIPEVKVETNKKQFPLDYKYFADTLCIGKIMQPIGNADFGVFVAKWNMNTGKINPMKYTHPAIEKKRISFAASMEHGIYAECYSHHDLMTICDLDGNLKCNVYGKYWNSRKTNSVKFYGDVAFCKDRIIALYSSGYDRISKEMKVNYPTKFLVFDINGNYLKTLETGYWIVNFCYDKEKNRIILHLDDETQFAYLDLNGLIE